MAKTKTGYQALTSGCMDLNGSPWVFNEGVLYEGLTKANVKGKEKFFKKVRIVAEPVSVPAAAPEEAPVEVATAVPGEKRNVKKPSE